MLFVSTRFKNYTESVKQILLTGLFYRNPLNISEHHDILDGFLLSQISFTVINVIGKPLQPTFLLAYLISIPVHAGYHPAGEVTHSSCTCHEVDQDGHVVCVCVSSPTISITIMEFDRHVWYCGYNNNKPSPKSPYTVCICLYKPFPNGWFILVMATLGMFV